STISVIAGPSGCGKSTFIKAITGLLKPKMGTIEILGKKTDDLDTPDMLEILKKTGFLFQNGALISSLSVFENAALPLRMHTSLREEIIERTVRYKLRQVGLAGSDRLFPGELSGGMKKRAALARALIMDPPIVFCDEPSAGLDPVTSSGMDDLLLKIRNTLGITIIVVSHEIESIRKIADKIYYLDNGRLFFEGTVKEAENLKKGPLYNFFNRIAPA
ncbi:MAG: ABC transporter ATP-binding protein, partial [Fibrobacterota bacterium]